MASTANEIEISDERLAAIEAFNRGVRAMEEGLSDAAVAEWKAAWTADRGIVTAARNLLAYYIEQGAYAEGERICRDLLEQDPFDTDALIRHAALLRRLGRNEASCEAYKRAISIYPYYRHWYDELAEVLDLIGDVEEASRWRERGMTLDADMAEMAYDDAVRHLRRGNAEVAVACLQAVIEDFPANTDARLALATGLERLGRVEEALEEYAKALELTDVAQARIHFRRAKLLLRLNRRDDAVLDLEFALDHEPRYGRAIKLMRRVDPWSTALNNVSDKGASPGASGLLAAARPDQPGTHEPVDATGGQPRTVRADAPRLLPPDKFLAWDRQVYHVLTQALSIAGPTGRPGRVGLVIEPLAELAPAMTTVLNFIRRPEFGLNLLANPNWPRVAWLEMELEAGSAPGGVSSGGWLGTPGGPEVTFAGWGTPADGLPIDDALQALRDAGGDDGFNVILVAGSGRVRADQNDTVRHLRRLPCFQLVMLRPQHAAPDLSLRLQGIAPNWVEISLPR
jgi:tetratricopeptide (TPR) repeat protein